VPQLHKVIIRRWVQLQDRLLWLEDAHGPDSRQAEQAVKALIDFEENAGSALAAALALGPARPPGRK